MPLPQCKAEAMLSTAGNQGCAASQLVVATGFGLPIHYSDYFEPKVWIQEPLQGTGIQRTVAWALSEIVLHCHGAVEDAFFEQQRPRFESERDFVKMYRGSGGCGFRGAWSNFEASGREAVPRPTRSASSLRSSVFEVSIWTQAFSKGPCSNCCPYLALKGVPISLVWDLCIYFVNAWALWVRSMVHLQRLFARVLDAARSLGVLELFASQHWPQDSFDSVVPYSDLEKGIFGPHNSRVEHIESHVRTHRI